MIEDEIINNYLRAFQVILICIQFFSIYRSRKVDKIRRLKEDKERLQKFLELAIPVGIPGAIRFLSIYKDPWLLAWYYKLRNITRLSLYRYGDIDYVGSHTKFRVNKKDFFHLQLKGCIDTEDPELAVVGIDYLAADYLTK